MLFEKYKLMAVCVLTFLCFRDSAEITPIRKLTVSSISYVKIITMAQGWNFEPAEISGLSKG